MKAGFASFDHAVPAARPAAPPRRREAAAPALRREGRAAPVEAASPAAGHGAMRGIALIVGSTLFFSGADVIAKALTATLPPAEVAWLRYLTFALIVVPLLFVRGGPGLSARRPSLQILRGLGMVGSALFFTAGLRYLPVADSTAIYFVSPILITALSIPFLGETVGWRRWAAALVGLLGVLVVIRPGTSAFEMASLFPLAGATCWAAASIVTRKTSGTDRPITTMGYSALVGLAATTAMLAFDFVVPTGPQIALGLAFGALSTLGHWLVVLAYRHASASLIAPYGYAQLIWAGVLGFLVFGTLPDAVTIAGAAIIAASGLYTACRERARAA
ncbi:MAG TPA: DMT family transporter [Microvirga sp.]|jgi:drug/metabolite transporter (DMT)-like permease|nr:DMT family transporter [Microvirga sp.]